MDSAEVDDGHFANLKRKCTNSWNESNTMYDCIMLKSFDFWVYLFELNAKKKKTNKNISFNEPQD